MIKRFPYIMQRDAMDCGPSSLGMIARYYGRKPDLEKLRSQCFLARDGVSLLGISKAAEKTGFRTVGGRLTFEVLAEKAPLPCIVHWNQNHFTVVYRTKKLRKGGWKIYVADPGKGLLTYTKEEFCRHWISTQSGGEEKGVVLLVEPTPLFFEGKDDSLPAQNRLKFLQGYLSRYRRFFLQLILGLFVGSLLQLALPFLTQSIVDKGIEGKDIGFIYLVLLSQLMLIFSRTAIEFVRSKILLHIGTRINISLVSDFFIKLMKLPMKFFDTKLMGDLLQRIEDHRRIEEFLTSNTLNLIFSVFTFVIFAAVLFVYNLPIFVVFLLGSFLYGGWILIFLRRRRILDYKTFEQQGLNRNVTYQLINGMQEIKLQGCEERKRWEWEDVQADLFGVNVESLNLQQQQQAGSVLVNELKNALITVLSATAVIKGSLTLGMMLSVQYIIGQLNSPVEQLVNFIYRWQDVSISLERMQEIHREKNEENEHREIATLPAGGKTIALEHMSFRYDGARPDYTLTDLSLEIPEGKVTAIVGASGSGKTTLLKLLLGYYPPEEGRIEVGGEDLERFNLQWWRRQCGVVMQEGYVFSDTIGRNISVSEEEPDAERIRRAAGIANISEDVESLPLGYNTKIGQDGVGLSQGQRQRILIARVVYKNPPFVFFDEATNSLDSKSERRIVENLEAFYKEKTVIVVAHRLSTVRNADKIVVLEGGRIVEEGDHRSLTEKRGKYYELVKNQLELGN